MAVNPAKFVSTRTAKEKFTIINRLVAVQSKDGKENYWIIETKGREYEDTDRKETVAKKWCEDVSKQTGSHWDYIKVPQAIFDHNKATITNFSRLVEIVRSSNKRYQFAGVGKRYMSKSLFGTFDLYLI